MSGGALRQSLLLALFLAAMSTLAVACGGPGRPVLAPPVATPGGNVVYLAVGASETVGFGSDDPLREAWPRIVFEHLGVGARFVNAGIPDATVASALADEVPLAVETHPTLVSIWLNANDLIAGVPVGTYEAQLGDLIHRLRDGGRATVLVANTPALDRLPAYLACVSSPDVCELAQAGSFTLPEPAGLDRLIDDYNAAIARVAGKEGAVVVDLHASSLAARTEGVQDRLVSDDGFHPSDAGHRRVAQEFIAALDVVKS